MLVLTGLTCIKKFSEIDFIDKKYIVTLSFHPTSQVVWFHLEVFKEVLKQNIDMRAEKSIKKNYH